MQTVIGKKYFEHPRFRTIRDLLRDCAEKYGDNDAYRYHDTPEGPDIVHSFRDFTSDIDSLGTGLYELGLAGTHIVVVGANCYEWAVSHNAIVNGLGVSVPLDRQLPEQEVINLSARGDVDAFIYNAPHHEIALAVAAKNQKIRYFICMKPGVVTPELQAQDSRFITYESVLANGKKRLTEGDRRFVDAPIDENAMCSLLFTSGTTAMSKGVMLSHRNVTSNVHYVVSTIYVASGQRALSVLPLHHTFENTVGMYMMLAFGCCICFTDGLRYLAQNLKNWKINIILAVPLLFENIYRQIEKNLQKAKKDKLVNLMRKVSNGLRKVGIDVRAKLFHQILEGVGGGLTLCVSGAAPIDEKIVAFFNDIGIDFLTGYGLTETSPVISACNQHVNVYGSVGNPLYGVEVAIDTDSSEPGSNGEILTRSESVMLGYYQNPEATAEVLSPDGWLRTGDIGYLDKRDCIHITGRVKSMIVLTNGKKAFPEEIEYLLSRIPGVRESIVWGDDSSHESVDISVKLVINRDDLPEEAKKNQAALAEYLTGQLKLVNQQMPAYKAIKYFCTSEQDLIKTTTLKVKRPAEMAKMQKRLEETYMTMKAANGRSID